MSEIFNAINKAGAALGELADEGPRELPSRSQESPAQLLFDEQTEPAHKIRDRALRALLRSDSVFSEQLRVLRTKVYALSNTGPFDCIGMVSAAEGEGKTTLSIGLAAALAAEKDRRVLLLEANLRRPAIEKRLGLSASAGLSEWLEGQVERILVRQIEPFGFFLLSSGAPAKKPSDLLNGERMEQLIRYCRGHYDYIILDCTSLTPSADAVVLQDQVDGILLVVRSRFTSQETIQRAMTHLRRGTVRGVVFNAHRRLLR